MTKTKPILTTLTQIARFVFLFYSSMALTTSCAGIDNSGGDANTSADADAGADEDTDTEPSKWSRNSFPGQGHVDSGLVPGYGSDHAQAINEVRVSPIDADRIIVCDDEWGIAATTDGVYFEPVFMKWVGNEGAKATDIYLSAKHKDRIYMIVASEYRDDSYANRFPQGVWKSDDFGQTWEHLYQLDAGEYERYDRKTGKARFLEDPASPRSDWLYYATTSHGLRYYNGSKWNDLIPDIPSHAIQSITVAKHATDRTVIYATAERKMPKQQPGEYPPLENRPEKDSSHTERFRFDNNLDGVNGYSLEAVKGSTNYIDSCVEGKNALQLNNTTFRSTGGGSAMFTGKKEHLTIAFWMKTTSGSDQVIISANRVEHFEIGINGPNADSGQLYFVAADDSNTQHEINYEKPINDGNWHHVTTIWDSGKMILIIDGSVEAESDTGKQYYGQTVYSNQLYVGGNWDSTYGQFAGTLDDLRIWHNSRGGLERAQGCYFHDSGRNPGIMGRLFRIDIDSNSVITRTEVTDHDDITDVELNMDNPSTGWMIRKGTPGISPFGGREIYKFSNWGANLTPAGPPLGKSSDFRRVYVHPDDSDHVVVLCNGVYKSALRYSIDGGATWSGDNRDDGDGYCPSLNPYSPSSYTYYNQGGLPAEGSKNWKGTQIAMLPGADNRGKLIWYHFVEGGLMKSVDYGQRFSGHGGGLLNKGSSQIDVSCVDSNHITVGFKEYGAASTENGGGVWRGNTHKNHMTFSDLTDECEGMGLNFSHCRVLSGVAYHPEDSDIILGVYSQAGFIVRSVDRGLNWSRVFDGVGQCYATPEGSPKVLASAFWSKVDPKGTCYMGMHKSTDWGATFSLIGKFVIAMSPSNPDIIVGSEDMVTNVNGNSLKLHISIDGGDSWVPLPEPEKEAVPGSSGESWQVTATRRNYNATPANLIAIDPSEDHDPTINSSNRLRILLAGRSGIYEYNATNECGSKGSWSINSDGIDPNEHFVEVAGGDRPAYMGYVCFDQRPGHERVVYAAKTMDYLQMGEWFRSSLNENRSFSGGNCKEPYYVSEDGGETWSKIPGAPEYHMNLTAITVDHKGVFYAVDASGVHIYDPSETSR